MECDCDTVMYSLSMACSTCQQGIAYEWERWIKQCNTVMISNYSGDIPQGTAIPHWAFYNVTLLNNHTFDNANAQSIGREPEAKPPQTSAASSSSKTALIIGGAVGGVVLLIIIPIIVYFGLRWRRRDKERKTQAQGQWDHSGGYRDKWNSPQNTPTSATYSQTFSTGPTLVSDLPIQPYTPRMPQPNRAVTYVTPMGNGGQ